MVEYWSKYYAWKANITEQNIAIKDTLKIQMLNNLGPVFITYLTVVNNQMSKDKKLKEDKRLFKLIQEEETQIVIEQNTSANFAMKKFNHSRLQERCKKK